MTFVKQLVTNCVSQGWRVAMSVAFIPFYIHFLGNDAFALIGLFVLLQAWLVVFDLVLQPTMAGMIGNAVELRSRSASLCRLGIRFVSAAKGCRPTIGM